MSASALPAAAIARVWRSAQLYIGFHRDQNGKRRDEAKVWPPKNGNATIHPDPENQEAFLVLKAEDKADPRDVQVKLRPNQIVMRRDEGLGWQGVVVDETGVSVQVNGTWVRIKGDGSVSQDIDGDTTWIEADGSVLKKTEFVDATMSADGVELSRRTDDSIAAIKHDGVVSKAR